MVRRTVRGPTLTLSTSICVRNRPVATGAPRSRSAWAKSSTSDSASSAGAAAELTSALLVNPHDLDGVTRALEHALTMEPEEERTRMRTMHRQVMTHDVDRWARSFLDFLDPATAAGADIPIEERAPDEVSDDAPAFNPAFDVTPAQLITAIFTEVAVLEPPYEESIARALGR